MMAMALLVYVNAAPILEQQPSLFEQQSQLYEILVQDSAEGSNDPDKPFSTTDVQDAHLAVSHQSNVTNAARKKVMATKVEAVFKIAAARDAAEVAKRKEYTDKIAKQTQDWHDAQNKSATAMTTAAKKTEDKAKEVVDSQTEKVHKILHPDDKEKEHKENEFIKSVANMAEGKAAIVEDGGMFEPGKPGDVPPEANATALPTAAEMEMLDTWESDDELAKGEEDDILYKSSTNLYEEMLK